MVHWCALADLGSAVLTAGGKNGSVRGAIQRESNILM
jgi:hypothetical protein